MLAAAAGAQYLFITAEQLQESLRGNKKLTVVDVRSFEEYREGHVPGAINIPSERISAERRRLPREKAAPIVFYCRGVG